MCVLYFVLFYFGPFRICSKIALLPYLDLHELNPPLSFPRSREIRKYKLIVSAFINGTERMLELVIHNGFENMDTFYCSCTHLGSVGLPRTK